MIFPKGYPAEVEVDGRKLRRGVTTGMCAAAAAKGAVLFFYEKIKPSIIEVKTPGGLKLSLQPTGFELGENYACCCIIKDGGDDPDATNGAAICARFEPGTCGVSIKGGLGVGKVTRPGLSIQVGDAAINPVPREVIRREVEQALPSGEGAIIEIIVPEGEKIAARTLNPKLGIEGGISILGTTGIVEPVSLDAFMRSLLPQVSVALAAGCCDLVLTPGRKGETWATARYGLPGEAVLQMSNFVGDMLKECARKGVQRVLLFGHHGKLVKVAAGNFQTHSKVSDGRLETMAALVALYGGGTSLVARILDCKTAEETVDILKAEGMMKVFDAAAERASAKARDYVYGDLEVGTVLLSLKGDILGMDSKAAEIGRDLGWKVGCIS